MLDVLKSFIKNLVTAKSIRSDVPCTVILLIGLLYKSRPTDNFRHGRNTERLHVTARVPQLT